MKNFFFRFNLSSSPHYSSIHYAFFDLSFETKIMVAVRQREREREKERGCSWSGYEECFKSWKAQKPLHGSKAQQNVTTGRTSDSLPRGRKVSLWSTLVCAIVCRPRDLRG